MYKLASISSEDSTVLYLFQQPHLVKINGIHRHDSLIAAIENPRQLNIRYEIYRGKKLVDAGQTQEAYYPINRKASNGQAYRIKYFFGWGGNDYPKNQKTFFHYQKKLTIQIDQPQAIVPGEQMQVRVKVLDHRKKAAAGVNLLAGSVNAQFQNARQYKAPRLTYKVGKTPAVKHRKLKWKEPNSHYWQLPLDTSWIRRLKVEQDLFYRLRFPRKTIFAQLDTIVNDGFYRDKALFAPYVVRKGRSKKVYLIYCNRRLIYCSETSDQSPYVFNGQPGYNTIEVRTQDHSYTIDSVFLKAGHKLEISIDEDHILPHKHVKSKSKPDTLEQFEYNFLKKHLLVIRNPTNSPLYLIQGDRNIRRLAFHRFQLQTRRKNREELLFVGPFIQNVPLTYIRPNAFVNTFLFEPGFLYEIAPQRERLYPLQWPKTVQLKEPYHLYRPGALTYKPDDIRLKTSEYNIHYSPRKRYDPTAGRGSYQWKLSKEDTLFKALVFVRADTVYGVYKLQNRKVRNLDPGLYQAFFIAENGFYKQRDVRIEANALTFQNWAATILQRDSSKYLYDQITYSDKAQAPPPGSIQDILSRPNKILLKNFDEATRLVHGKVIDGPTGEAIAFASVFISGTSTGTTTDLNGDFELEVPAGKYIVEVHFLGYEAVKIDMLAYYGSELNVAMYERQLSLDNEITVTATGRLSKRRSNVYRRGSTPNYLDLKLAGIETENTNIRIRGINSLENNGYLTVIDGIPAASGIKTIERMQREGKIKTLELMPADQARVRFNLDKAIPAIIIQTYKDRPPSEREKESQSIRNNFRDYAYWQPNLMTDKKGEATFQVHFPDNVTQWNNFVMGMDKKQRVGLVRSKTNAVKQLLGQLALPRFLVEGDKSSLIGKAINYTADSFRIQTTFEQEGMVLQQKEAFLRDALIEKVSVQANERADSLTFQYRLQRGDYADGEERRIPILRRGVEENKGHFWVLESDTSFQLDFDPAYGPVYLRAESDQLQLMHFAASKLTVYPHDCNEQVASKLIALLLTKMVCKASGKPFKSEKQIKKAIKRLESTQANIGAWGWWKDNPTDVWMTSHVFRALFLAKQSGYAASSTRKALQYLTSYLDLFGGNELLNALEILTHQNQNLDYESYIHKAEKQLPNPSSYQKLVLWKLRQSNNLEWPVDSLLQSMKKTFYGGLYHPGDPRHWYNNHIQNTLLAYCILLNAGRKDLCQKIERYIIRENRNGTWGNTARTAQVLLTVLPELLKNRSNLLKNTNLQITTDESVNIHKFPYTHTIPPNQKIKIHKEGLNPLYLTAYQKRWEPTPKARANGFEVTSQLLQFGKTTKHLKTSETAQIKVSVTIEEKMEYIMVEVPIPAGCSYGPKSSRWLYRQRTNKSEVHREYFKDHVAIFCRTLPPGTHEFTIDLEARFDGHYTLNPATAQEMYFPTLNGRTNSKKVKLTP
ncbi:MAG: alpha-2-macroglobulin family protein [Bacteroidota bacterium]